MSLKIVKEPKKKRSRGRPTGYKKEYCQQLIEHMSDGFSFESFAAEMKCSVECIYQWEHKYPDFSEAKKEGRARERRRWEKILDDGAKGTLPKTTRKIMKIDPQTQKVLEVTIIEESARFNVTAAIFALKNKFPKDWRDRKEIVDIPVKDGFDHMNIDELEEQAKKNEDAIARMKKRK